MRKLIVGFVIAAVIAALVFANVRNARRRGVEVDVESVARRDLVAEVSGSGRIEARRSVDVVANVVGKVLEVAAEEGDLVERGDLILRIDPAERRALLEQAKATLAGAEARAELARAELRQADLALERARGLVAQGLGSAKELESAETGHEVQSARLAAAVQDVRDARARVEHAETELARTVIRADITGILVRLAVEEGENVLAGDLYNSGSSLVTIADLSEMEAQILVDETEVVRTKPGQEAVVEIDAFPDRKIPGTVLEVGNSAYNSGPLGTQEAKDFRVRILLREVPEGLRPGLSARADIVTDTRDSVLAVPIEALALRDPAKEADKANPKKRAKGSAASAATDSAAAPADTAAGASSEDRELEGVFVVEDKVARFTPVKTGIAGDRHFEVLSGLAEGAVVVRGPFDALRRLGTGDRVRVREEKERRAAKGSDKDGDDGEEAGE